MTPRVDIFSLKGGVGKTTLAILLGRAQARATGKPALVVDADLTGTCLGDLLEFWAAPTWHDQFNLSHLVCGRPERLVEDLEERVPVFVYRPTPPGDRRPRRLGRDQSLGPELLFCPSHIESTSDSLPPIDREVLVALLGNETAGGWVRHVIDRVIAHTAALAGQLACVIVDHSPGMSSLQTAVLDEVIERRQAPSGTLPRKLLFVTSRDAVDLASANSFQARFSDGNAICWLVNRMTPAGRGGPGRGDALQHLPPAILESTWFVNAVRFLEDPDMAATYANAACLRLGASNETPLERVRATLFGATAASAP